jgi:hypothetical protein
MLTDLLDTWLVCPSSPNSTTQRSVQLGHGYNAEVQKCGSGYGYNALSLTLFLTLIHDTDYHGGTRVPNRRP